MKSLIIYFSRRGENIVDGKHIFLNKGNTRIVAEKIAELSGGVLYELQPKTMYSEIYEVCNEQARVEHEKNVLPEITNPIGSVANFDVIYIGFPIWHRSYPRIIQTLINTTDFSGKIVKPFCTNDEGTFGTAELELKSYLQGKCDLRRGLSVNGFKLDSCDEAIKKFVNA